MHRDQLIALISTKLKINSCREKLYARTNE